MARDFDPEDVAPACSPCSLVWRKSSYSNGGENCVEITNSHKVVPVRDSKDPTGPALVFSTSAWTSFVEALKHGELHA